MGLGLRPELAADLFAARGAVGFVEVVAETCFANRAAEREALAAAAVWPVLPHGVKLSLGSADGLDESRVGKLAALARSLRAPVVSEHVAFTRGGAREIGHLTMLPRTREAVRVVAKNVARARLRLPDVPLLLENVAWTMRLPGDEMDEPTFYQEIVRATGCDLLLDVSNLYANAVNEGLDPADVLARFPLDRVAMLHVAGGVVEDGFYYDTHADPIPEPVMALVGAALAACPDAPVLLERDANFDDFAALRAEIERMAAMRPAPAPPRALPAHEPAPPPADEPLAEGLLAAQLEAATLLTLLDPAPSALAAAIGAGPLARARAVLERKRVDDALPLLPRLARRAAEVRPIAERITRSTERASRGAGPADARAIAEAAARVPELAADALADALLVRARFSAPSACGAVAPRVAPFAGRADLGDGRVLFAVKGPGAFAPLHLYERKEKGWQASSTLSPRA
jgi:uncharacterized protein (UPF0276 family)